MRLVRPKQNVSFHLSKSSCRPKGMHTFQIENCNNTQIVVRINPKLNSLDVASRRVAPISGFSLGVHSVNSSKSKRAPANCRGADQFKPVDYIFQKCKRLYNTHSFPSRPQYPLSLPLSLFLSLPPSLLLARSPVFFSFTQEFFNIRYTSLGMSRVSIFHFVGNRATDVRPGDSARGNDKGRSEAVVEKRRTFATPFG